LFFLSTIIVSADDRFATAIVFKTEFGFAAAIHRQASQVRLADCKEVSQYLALVVA